MKRLYFIFLFLSLATLLPAQPTWIQRTFFGQYNTHLQHDSLTGMREIKIGTDGSIYVLAFCTQEAEERLMKFQPDSGRLLWENYVGLHGGMSGHMSNALLPTQDSGCIISINDWGNTSDDGRVEKYGSDGILQWSCDLNSVTGPNGVIDIIENSYGNYYALVDDINITTLFELDRNGTQIFQTVFTEGDDLFTGSNGQFMILTRHNTLDRMDSTGFVYWSIPCQGVLGADTSIAFILNPSGVQKIQLSTGQVLWTKTFPFGLSAVDVLDDGGFIGSSGKIPHGNYGPPVPYYLQNSQIPGSISRVDSSGNTIWTKQYNFPKYGFSCVRRLHSGNIVTGGAFIFFDYIFYQRDYSSFIATLDSTGNSVIESISYTWPGDANDNHYLSFVDDVLNTGIAMGYTGSPRDTLTLPYSAFPFVGIHSDYAVDWGTSSNYNVNHKHADFNGDGRIDTVDLNMYNIDWPLPLSIPNWSLRYGVNYDNFIPELKFSAINNTVQAGDTIRYYIILGSGSVPVDTIYGLAFQTSYAQAFEFTDAGLDFIDGQLGTSGTDFYTRFLMHGTSFVNLGAVWCRTDRHDVYNVINDTLGILEILTDPTWTNVTPLNLNMDEIKAVKFDEGIVDLNVTIDSVIVYPLGSDIESMLDRTIRIYPNPVNSKLIIDGISSNMKPFKIELTNLFGVKILESKITELNSGNSTALDCSGFPNGTYFIKISDSANNLVRKIILQH